jgi:hypothetical protein
MVSPPQSVLYVKQRDGQESNVNVVIKPEPTVKGVGRTELHLPLTSHSQIRPRFSAVQIMTTFTLLSSSVTCSIRLFLDTLRADCFLAFAK